MDIIDYRDLFQKFPLLDQYPLRFRKTSEKSVLYNCIAWAMGDTKRFWWPTMYGYWPPDCLRSVTIHAFEQAFASRGYQRCGDASPGPNAEMIALYAKESKPTHAARQLSNGRWTSKLGANIDIEHELEDLQGPEYGMIVAFFRRDRRVG